MASLVHLERF
jgi:hypothetical protein